MENARCLDCRSIRSVGLAQNKTRSRIPPVEWQRGVATMDLLCLRVARFKINPNPTLIMPKRRTHK